jgi:hypothetical protein
MLIKIKKGLDLPITGEPAQTIHDDGATVGSVSGTGRGLQWSEALDAGLGGRLGSSWAMCCLPTNSILKSNLLRPVAGVVKAIHRGERRALQSVVIELDGNDSRSICCVCSGRSSCPLTGKGEAESTRFRTMDATAYPSLTAGYLIPVRCHIPCS